MNNETLDIIQELLNLLRAQGKRIARLEASNALQNCALVSLLENAGDGSVPSRELSDAYGAMIQRAEDDDAFRSLLQAMERKFPSLRG